MTANICAGTDLHDVTATRLFGDGFTDAQRVVTKGAGSPLDRDRPHRDQLLHPVHHP
jgi:hypothetical protein